MSAPLIIHNARVRTLDPARPEAAAIACDGERIVAVGSDAAVMRTAARSHR